MKHSKLTMLTSVSLMVGVLSFSQTAFGYGAIAYSKSTGAAGYSHGLSSKNAATASAVKYCGKRDCNAVLWINNSCGAVLRKKNNPAAIATGWSNSKNGAINNASAGCGKNCRVVVALCDKNR